jgi:hypothetical protein
MVNGRYDFLFPFETAQRAMFRALSVPADSKRHVIVDDGHSLSRIQNVSREVLPWLDRYLGPVRRRNR